MITAKGRTFIRRYLAGVSGDLVGAISVGVGETAADLSDTAMEFEFARIPVDVIGYDFAADRLVFKGAMDDSLSGNIYEVGIWTSEINSSAGNQGSKIITSFDSATENWSNDVYDSTHTRIGVDSLIHNPTSAQTTSILTGVSLDFIESSSQDKFLIAYYVDDANCSEVALRFRTDSSNYYEFITAAPGAGYHVDSFKKGTADVTGSPSWNDINSIQVATTGVGTTLVSYDGVRLEDTDTAAPEYGLVARTVLVAPVEKIDGRVQDIEFTLAVTF